MNNLELKDSTKVMERKIPEISGGFGENKKSMLAQDIAGFHNKELRFVNQNINRNKDKFRGYIDIIDLKQHKDFVITLCNSGILTQNQVNASKNIYLLSERGYAKLIKIFDDNLSWEIYDRLLDEYFEMKISINESILVNKVDAASKIAPGFITLGQAFGMSEQSAKTYAIQEMKKYIPEINYDPLLQGNVIEQPLYSPTDLGKKIDLSAIKFNKILRDLGYQYKENKNWCATEKGEPFSDVISQEGNGTRLSLRWTKEILEQKDVIKVIG